MTHVESLNAALAKLCDKYPVKAAGALAEADGEVVLRLGGAIVPLLPWRVERRFTELKKIVDGKTLEDVSTLRFATFAAGGTLDALIMPQFDLAAFLSGSAVTQVYATRGGDTACNVLFRLGNGWSGCIEAGTALPAGTAPIDRHEIIARRGVASDRVVDSQVPQDSIYEWTAAGHRTYTDVDNELYGLANPDIWRVRAAFAVLLDPGLAPIWQAAAARARALAAGAAESARTAQVIHF